MKANKVQIRTINGGRNTTVHIDGVKIEAVTSIIFDASVENLPKITLEFYAFDTEIDLEGVEVNESPSKHKGL